MLTANRRLKDEVERPASCGCDLLNSIMFSLQVTNLMVVSFPLPIDETFATLLQRFHALLILIVVPWLNLIS